MCDLKEAETYNTDVTNSFDKMDDYYSYEIALR